MRRTPAGLSLSILIAAISLGVIWKLWTLEWPTAQGTPLLAHSAATLCLIWSTARYLLTHHFSNFSIRPLGRDLLDVLLIASLVTGLFAVIIMVYVAVTEGLCRTVFFSYESAWRVNIWPSGSLDLGLIAGAVLLQWPRRRNSALITVLFWLMILAGLWVAFQIPRIRLIETAYGTRYPVASDWARWFMLISALLIGAFTATAGLIERRRRIKAWPNALWLLTAPAKPWDGFRYSMGIVAVPVLILGCIYILSPMAMLSAFLVGGSALTLVGRRWEHNLADVGLALITLAAISLLMFGSPKPPWSTGDYAVIFNRLLVGLAVMSWFWYWLAGVWKQQLDNGQAWTTAGQLIRITERVGYMVGAIALLVSAHLAVWPKLPYVIDPDNAPSRLFWGLFADGLLILSLSSAARRTNKPTLAWLTLFAGASTGVFVLTRSAGIAQWWLSYWPIALSGFAGLALVAAAVTCRRKNWRCFVEPLQLTGVLLVPLFAIIGVSLIEQLRMPQWVTGATFCSLAGVYLLASWVPGPGTFAAVGLICAIMGIWHLRPLVASTIIPLPYFCGFLTGLSATLLTIVYRDRGHSNILRFMKWAGGILALISVVAGWIVAHS